jgi:TonB family protein
MKRVLWASLLVGACVGFITPAFGQQGGTPPARIGGEIRQPTKIKDLAPVYPPEARRAGISGSVILEAIIGEDGKVRSARVLRSIPLLDQAALDAVQQWEYTPTLINGVAVPIVMTLTVNFTLQGSPAAAQLPPPPPNTMRLYANRGPNGQAQVWELDITKAAGLPRWNPGADPPVSVGEAARLAGTWLSGLSGRTQGERLVLQNASLLRRPLPMDAEFWYYMLAYSASPLTSAPAPPFTVAPAPPFTVVVLMDGSVLAPKEVAASAAQSPDPRSVPIPPGVTPPRAIQEVKPTYTPEALRQKISGSVFIQGIVGVDGTFRNLQVVRSLDTVYGLDDAALKAASQWRFIPGMKDGQPVPVVMTVELSFYVR